MTLTRPAARRGHQLRSLVSLLQRSCPLVTNLLSLVKATDHASGKFFVRYAEGMVNPDRIRPYEDIAARLRAAREAYGESLIPPRVVGQQEFAEKAGLKHSQYKNWESGAFQCSLSGARALRKTYGLSLDFIFEGILDALPMSLRSALSDKLLDK